MNNPYSVLPNASRTSADDKDHIVVNRDNYAILVVIDITANAGGLGSLTVTVLAKDPTSGKLVSLLASAALTAVATTTLKIFPGAPITANVSANDMVPNDIVVRVAHNANPIVYSVGAQLMG